MVSTYFINVALFTVYEVLDVVYERGIDYLENFSMSRNIANIIFNLTRVMIDTEEEGEEDDDADRYF